MLPIYGTFSMPTEYPYDFTRSMGNAVRWAENVGVDGMLIFTDNDSIDPWVAAQFLIERTASLVPLVAVQPLYMHPYTAARMVSTISSLYGRRVDLNLVTGGYRPHLRALGCDLDHDARYARLIEYGQVLDALLGHDGPVDYCGSYYDVRQAILRPAMPAGFPPRLFVAGTSPAAATTAEELGAIRLMYPTRPETYAADPNAMRGTAIRVGIIARATSDEAWELAHTRFPHSPIIEEFREYAVPDFDAQWHGQIWEASERQKRPDTYWLYPFRISREFCPYLVGSYAEVSALLSRYLDLGAPAIILNQARSEEDLAHAVEAIRRAQRLSSATGAA